MLANTARNATLSDLAALLRDQHSRKLDIVLPAASMRSVGGVINLLGSEPVLTEDGVTMSIGRYRPTDSFDAHLAEKLDIPLRYLRRMRSDRVDLYDANVNGWLHGRGEGGYHEFGEVGPDERSFLLRAFRSGEEGGEGIARALLSDRYGIVDNLDVLTAVLAGVRASGVEVEILSCDLSERRMYVKIAAPAVAALAPELLAGYRSPFSGASADENPTVFAGFVVSNSEVGSGAFSLTPRLIVQVCTNGMTITKDAMRAVHLGGRLEEGIVRWSEDTQRKNLEIVTAKARDAVATFLDVDYVRAAIARLSAAAGAPVANAAGTIEILAKRLAFSQEESDGILDSFIRGGQMTAGGVMQAITAYAQTVPDADAAHELEIRAIEAMELALSASELASA